MADGVDDVNAVEPEYTSFPKLDVGQAFVVDYSQVALVSTDAAEYRWTEWKSRKYHGEEAFNEAKRNGLPYETMEEKQPRDLWDVLMFWRPAPTATLYRIARFKVLGVSYLSSRGERSDVLRTAWEVWSRYQKDAEAEALRGVYPPKEFPAV